MSSSWLDPEGSVTSGVPLGGWLPCGGGCVERCSWEVRESFWVSSRGVLWFSSLFVPSRVGFRAGNTVGVLFGFSASLQPNQNAYTKVIQSKAAEFRPHICTCPAQIG